MDFCEKWICCASVDDEEVVANMRQVRMNPDVLAIECVGYTHDPIVSHLTGRADRLAVVDNMFNHAREVDDVGVVAQADQCVVSSLELETKDALYSQYGGVTHQVVAQLVADIATATAEEVLDADVVVNSGMTEASSVYRMCQDVVEVKAHRRLPHSRHGDYVASMVSEVKNRLGCPKPTEANKLAVRRMVFNNATQHGLRPTALREVLELVVAGVFVPDEQDLAAARMFASNTQAMLTNELQNAKPVGAWSRLFAPFGRSRIQTRLRMEE